ncbi:MAG: S9 family peptidase [Planctomycetales bacterium]|nr:S9 family peptidase [Planctomycetales bacterium]
MTSPAPRPLDRYLAVRRFLEISFSPDGSEIAFTADISGQWNVWRMRLDGSPPIQRTMFEEEAARAIAWNPRRDETVIAADRHGTEDFQLYLLRGPDEWPEALTNTPKVKHILSSEAWSPDGRAIAFSSNGRKPEDFDVFVRDMASGETTRLLEDGRFNHVMRWTPDGRGLLVLYPSASDDTELELLDVRTREARHLTPWPGNVQVAPVGFSADGRRVLVVTDRDREFVGLAWLDVASGALEWVETPEHDIEDAALSHDGALLAVVVNVDGASRLRIRDLRAGRDLAAPEVPLGAVADLAWDPAGKSLAFRVNAATQPNTPHVLPVGASAPRRLAASLLPGFVPPDLVAPEAVRIPSHDGRDVPAWLYKPPGAAPSAKCPALLSIHGGPEAQERPIYYPLYQWLLHLGIAILAPNVRGSTGFGKSYRRLIHRDWGGGDLRDFAACGEFLRRTPWVDPARLGVFGGSYGGFATLSCATRLPEYWACAVDVVGPSNLLTFLKSVPPAWRRFMKDWVGDPEQDRDFLMERSPITYADRLRCPILIVQGANDPRVAKAESDQFVERLRSRGVTVEYDVYDDEGHGFTKTGNQVRAWKRIGEFLVRHLRP